MHILITCGPGSEPIDEVRRITNFSTGKLGIFLSNYFFDHGYQVSCLMGTGRTYRAKLHAHRIHEFTTTEDLSYQLQQLSEQEEIDVVLHAAALSDYVVEKITTDAGVPVIQPKISSDYSSLLVTLKPAPKLISRLRYLFPNSRIVGWKYELAPSMTPAPPKEHSSQNHSQKQHTQKALDKAFHQIQENKTDACVLNGTAIGSGFIFCKPDGSQHYLKDLSELAPCLLNWIEDQFYNETNFFTQKIS
jgi:phosphopantothenoylcysteine decarboxylase/phosphopantothenate--cysteine ligase